MSIITISHEAFRDGRQIAVRVTAILNYRCTIREVLGSVANNCCENA
jgi:hypothetical protein